MKIVDTVKRSGRNLRQAKVRTLLTAAALAVGGFTLTITLAASTGAHRYSDKIVQANFDPKAVFVVKDKGFFSGSSNKPQQYSNDLASTAGGLLKQLDGNDLAKLQRMPHVTSVIADYNLSAQFITRPGANKYTGSLNVYDPAQKPQIKAGMAPDTLASGSALISDDYLPLLNFASAQSAIGQTVSVQVRQLTGKTQLQSYKIVGVTTKSSLDIGAATVGLYLSQDDAKAINAFTNGGTVLADKVPSATVRGDGISADQLKQELTNAGFIARTSADLQKFLNQIINVLQGIIIVFGLITLIASFFGVVNTQYISVLERTREIGLMKALGMSRRTVSRLFIIEATWIGFIGALLGSLLAVAVGTAMNPWISRKLSFGQDRLLVFEPKHIVGLIIFLMFITTIAGLLPARKAAKLDPIEALRTE